MKKNILIVEDSSSICKILAALFERDGDYAICSCCFRDAAEIIRDPVRFATFDCVILDIVLDGEGDGADVIREILKTDHRPRVVIYSGWFDAEQIDNIASALSYQIVQKPAIFRDLYLAAFPGSVVH